MGATDTFKDVAGFSNLPGLSCANDFIFAPGTRIKCLSLEAEKEVSGTSFSAPIVASTLALLKKYFPALDMVTLKEILLSTASPFPRYTGKVSKEITGRGQLDAFKAFLQANERSEPKKEKSNCLVM